MVMLQNPVDQKLQNQQVIQNLIVQLKNQADRPSTMVLPLRSSHPAKRS